MRIRPVRISVPAATPSEARTDGALQPGCDTLAPLQPRSIRVAPTPLPGDTRLRHPHEGRTRRGIPLRERQLMVLSWSRSTGRKWFEKSPTNPTPSTLRAVQTRATRASVSTLKLCYRMPPLKARRSVRGEYPDVEISTGTLRASGSDPFLSPLFEVLQGDTPRRVAFGLLC
jgi:hypothetical protein